MAKFLIEGGHRLVGELRVHGAKNAVLPILAASLLCERTVLHHCPSLSDVAAAEGILEHLGCTVRREGQSVFISTQGADYRDLPDELVREMRSSILFLGAILARCGRARVSFPGGCELGPRPIDMHIAGLRRLGAQIDEDHGYLDCRVEGRMRGADITLPFPSVGATENLMLAAATALGETIIRNAAREPEIVDLADFLNESGAKVRIEGDRIVLEGVERLGGAEHVIIPDRIETATLLAAAAATGGELLLTGVCPAHLAAVLPVFEEMGCRLRCTEQTIAMRAPARTEAVRAIKTAPYPGFPTDAQAPIMAALTVARGASMFVENIFESRYKQVGELLRMGAQIETQDRVAVVRGVERLHSAAVRCTDLRGGAALAVAALAAEGISELSEIRHIDRGYADFEETLRALGASITREGAG
ncbi:MAG: UDP-N-acetylglucosamine 1-carboxyvinyltransferase [Oscillospiraceae bacterium]